MKGDAFRDWATGAAGLSEGAARAHLGHLNDVERQLATTIEAEWQRDRLALLTTRLAQDDRLTAKTRADYQSGLETYRQFRRMADA